MADLGYTHIHEHIRQHFGISRDEYALCNYVQTWAAHPKNARPGWCNRTQKQMADFIGITDRGLRKMLLKMVALALVTKDPMTAHHRISTEWFEMVTSAKEEQSSGIDQNQMRNKVPNDAEQSSSQMRNKVPTHNKYNKEVIVIDNVGFKNADGETLKITLHDALTVPLEATPIREGKPPIPKPPQVEVPKRKADPNDPRGVIIPLMASLKEEGLRLVASDAPIEKIERVRDHFRKMADQVRIEDNIDAVVTRLNEKAKMPRGYKADKKETRTAIRKRLKEYGLEDLFTVVDFKCREWQDDAKLRQYLRPDTLFNGHFEDYLNAALLDKQNPITASTPYATPAFRHEAPPPNTKQPDYVA